MKLIDCPDCGAQWLVDAFWFTVLAYYIPMPVRCWKCNTVFQVYEDMDGCMTTIGKAVITTTDSALCGRAYEAGGIVKGGEM
jgi:hypothetical protein